MQVPSRLLLPSILSSLLSTFFLLPLTSTVAAMFQACIDAGVPVERLAAHMHDTYALLCFGLCSELRRCCLCSALPAGICMPTSSGQLHGTLKLRCTSACPAARRYGQGLSNILASLQLGVRVVDSSGALHRLGVSVQGLWIVCMQSPRA